MTRPLVSIVVPSLQQGRFLRTALDSILDQDYHPIEVLVFDGGSTDDTLRILEQYRDRVWYRSDADGGQGQAINQGFRAARGEVVAWLNSDDFYYPGAVSRAVDALRDRPDVGLVYGEGNLVDEDGAVLTRFAETVPFDLWRLANVSDYILQPTVFFRRRTLLEHGMLDECLDWGLDWDLWLRLGRAVDFACIDETVAASRVHDGSKTATGGFRRLRELHRILRRHGVRGPSPAAVAHLITTVIRSARPSRSRVASDEIAAEFPPGARSLVRISLRAAEHRLRRWLQNAQGIWRDRLVAGAGHLWLPTDGTRTTLRVEGCNLDLPDQVVCVGVGSRRARTDYLDPGERFRLSVDLSTGVAPVKTLLSCSRTTEVEPLDPRLGPRRAGFRLARVELS